MDEPSIDDGIEITASTSMPRLAPRDLLLHLTPSVHETHGTTQIQSKPSNNSSQGPKKNQKNFSMIRNIKNKIAKLRDRGKR